MKFSEFLREQKEQHAVMAFGRMNPPTVGHAKLVDKVKEVAAKNNASHHVILSHSQDSSKNPLSAKDKLKHAKRFFPNTNLSVSSSEHPTFLQHAAKLHKQGVTHLHMVAGSDRVPEYKKKLAQYNGTHEGALFNFKKITVHSAGHRDPDAEGTEGMSASKMRGHAESNNFKEFKKGIPSHVPEHHAKELMQDVRKGMKLKEDIDTDFAELLIEGVHDKSIFKAVFLAGGPGSGKDYVLDNTLAGHGLTEINSDKALEFLMDKHGLDKTMPPSETEIRDAVRGKAKSMTELRQKLALFGRNGLIINGTGDDHEKIKRIKSGLEKLGYDTSMVMVNTRDEVSAARNIERGQRGGRTVPEKIRREKWEAVQNARPELAKMFGQNYKEFDNSEDLREAPPEVVKAKKDEMLELYKSVQDFVSQPPQSEVAQGWVAQELQKKDTLPVPKNGAEMTPHPNTEASQEAKRLGLQYYGFGRYGKNGKVTHRSVHDKLVEVSKIEQQTPKDIPTTGTSMQKKTVNEEFEELFAEDLRQWFDPKHPKGGWKRINSKGEAIGPCAREPGEAKPKCMSNEKRAKLSKKERASAVAAKRRHDPNPERKGGPINVSNFGKGKISETINIDEEKEVKLLKDKSGKVRTFMLRRAAAKEAHTSNGTVMPYKNGYAIKLNEEKENAETISETFWKQTTGTTSDFRARNTGTIRTEGVADLTSGQEYSRGEGITGSTSQEATGSKTKITIGQIRSKQKAQVRESIDKGIEPGLSMATSGENLLRKSLRVKQKEPLEELTGDETTASIGAQKEDELKKVGINIKTFKAKRPI